MRQRINVVEGSVEVVKNKRGSALVPAFAQKAPLRFPNRGVALDSAFSKHFFDGGCVFCVESVVCPYDMEVFGLLQR